MRPKKSTSVVVELRLLAMSIAIVATILAVAALRTIRPVAMPLTFSVFLAILVTPLRSRLNKRLPRWLSLMIVLAIIFAVLSTLGGALLIGAEQLKPQLPGYAERLWQLWQAISA